MRQRPVLRCLRASGILRCSLTSSSNYVAAQKHGSSISERSEGRDGLSSAIPIASSTRPSPSAQTPPSPVYAELLKRITLESGTSLTVDKCMEFVPKLNKHELKMLEEEHGSSPVVFSALVANTDRVQTEDLERRIRRHGLEESETVFFEVASAYIRSQQFERIQELCDKHMKAGNTDLVTAMVLGVIDSTTKRDGEVLELLQRHFLDRSELIPEDVAISLLSTMPRSAKATWMFINAEKTPMMLAAFIQAKVRRGVDKDVDYAIKTVEENVRNMAGKDLKLIDLITDDNFFELRQALLDYFIMVKAFKNVASILRRLALNSKPSDSAREDETSRKDYLSRIITTFQYVFQAVPSRHFEELLSFLLDALSPLTPDLGGALIVAGSVSSGRQLLILEKMTLRDDALPTWALDRLLELRLEHEKPLKVTFTLLEVMKHRKVSPSPQNARVVMVALARYGSREDVRRLLPTFAEDAHCEDNGVFSIAAMDAEAIRHLLSVFDREDDVEGALRVLTKMWDLDIERSSKLYSDLIEILTRKGRIADARRVLLEMKQQDNITPDLSHYEPILRAELADKDESGRVWTTTRQIMSCGLLNGSLGMLVLERLLEQEDNKKAVELFSAMAKSHDLGEEAIPESVRDPLRLALEASESLDTRARNGLLSVLRTSEERVLGTKLPAALETKPPTDLKTANLDNLETESSEALEAEQFEALETEQPEALETEEPEAVDSVKLQKLKLVRATPLARLKSTRDPFPLAQYNKYMLRCLQAGRVDAVVQTMRELLIRRVEGDFDTYRIARKVVRNNVSGNVSAAKVLLARRKLNVSKNTRIDPHLLHLPSLEALREPKLLVDDLSLDEVGEVPAQVVQLPDKPHNFYRDKNPLALIIAEDESLDFTAELEEDGEDAEQSQTGGYSEQTDPSREGETTRWQHGPGMREHGSDEDESNQWRLKL